MPKSSSGYDTIWVQSVDKTEPKSVIFLPIREDYKTEKLAKIYVNEIVARHGVPVSIISDRDGRFTSHLWQALQEALGTRLDMSTAYHPQTDGSDVNSIFRAGGYASSISPVIWTEVGESQLIGPEIVQETTEKIFNQGKMKTAEVARKSYADKWDSSPFIFAATILQSSSAIHHISNIDNMYIKSYSFSLFSSLPGVLTPVRAINGFDMPLPVAVCSGLVNPLAPRKVRFIMDDPNITMEEYIKLQAEKVQRRDFEADFPSIVYNDALTSKENVSPEPTDSFSYKLILVDNLKPEPVNDHIEINTELPSKDIDIELMDSVVCISNDTTPIESDEHLETNHDKKSELSETNMAQLPIRAQRQPWLIYEVKGYTDEIVQDFEQRLAGIFNLEDDGTFSFQLGGAKREMSWRQFILALGLHTVEEIDIVGFRAYWDGSSRIRDPLRRLCHRLIAHTIVGREQAPKKVTCTNLYFMRSMDREVVNLPYLLAHYLFRHAEERKHEAEMSGGHFIGRIADYFGLLIEERLPGTTVVAWVAPGTERQQVAAAKAPKDVEGAHAEVEGDQAISAPVQAPQPLLPAAQTRTMLQRITRLE
ncbi:putative reverse transcriptase domain-containing protein [Tanacetum coccineum]|uniref:Reverse transcriptase domain-containing protein n=1 Tax=Tanacetum coccineum TaxID=301880 RepID=A0ABQ5AGL1_9ASTR